MKTKIYTNNEIEFLKNNKFVIDILYKREFKYSNIFKLWAVFQKINYPEKTARNIFEEAGFNIKLMNNKLPQSRIRSWLLIYERYGIEYFLSSNSICKIKNDCLIKLINTHETLEDNIYKKIVLELDNMLENKNV
ncbi:MAG: hypothetical protein RRY16_02870 [Bacilli bacterium]